MRERPILFSDAMVRAILDGTKTQTRRVVKYDGPQSALYLRGDGALMGASDIDGVIPKIRCPYGIVGDRLWVRETCALVKSPGMGDWRWPTDDEDADAVWYRATDSLHLCHGPREIGRALDTYALVRPARWRPSIHMPRWASRITLELTDVRVERVQDISERDARAEGCDAGKNMRDGSCRDLFSVLWDGINTERGYPWASNPRVWALTFKRIGGGA